MAEKIGLSAVFETAAFSKGLNTYMQGLGKAENQGQRSAGIMSKVGAFAGGVLKIGLAAGAAAAVGIATFLGESARAAIEAESAMADLNAVIASTGGVAGVTATEAAKIASALQNVTAFDDETIISGESMLLTFKNIGQDVFPMATEAMLNMSQKMGTDVKTSAIQLGKALNDPIAGVASLRRVGVQLTDQQTDLIKTLVESGDVAGAQKIILGELEDQFGGLARAAGNTTAGKIERLKNKFGDLKESVGVALLPVMHSLADTLLTAFDDPKLQASLASFGEWLGKNLPIAIQTAGDFFQTQLIPALTAAWNWFQINLLPVLTQVWTWLQTNIPLAIAATSAFFTNVLIPAITDAWNWFEVNLLPTFQTVAAWLQENIPAAISTASSLFTGTLIPAVKMAWDWFETNLLPTLTVIWDFLSNLWVSGIKQSSDSFSNVLLPAVTAIWDWINTNLIPMFVALADLLIEVVGLAITGLSTLWTEVLAPALETVFDWIELHIVPAFNGFVDLLKTGVIPAVESVVKWIGERLADAFSWVTDKIQEVAAWIGNLRDMIGGLGGDVAGVSTSSTGNGAGVQPGTGFAEGGHYRAGQVAVVGDGGRPEVFVADKPGYIYPSIPDYLSSPAGQTMGGGMMSVVNNYNLSVETEQSSGNVVRDFAMMRLLQ